VSTQPDEENTCVLYPLCMISYIWKVWI